MTTQPPAQELPELPYNGPWKQGNEFLPYHPKASHIEPDHRDGWNACYWACIAASQAGRAAVTLERISERKLKDLQDRGYVIDGYAIKKVEGTNVDRGFITEQGLVGWWFNKDQVEAREAMSECGLCDNRHTADAIAKCPHGKFCGAKAAS